MVYNTVMAPEMFGHQGKTMTQKGIEQTPPHFL